MLFFEYYTKYNLSPTEHQVFTSPPTERSIYFVHHHVLPLSVFIFQEHSSVSELMLQDSPRPLRCWKTLARPRSCSGTLARPRSFSGTLARPRSCSGTHQTTPCSGTSSLAPRPVLGDCLDHSPTTALGLHRSFLNPRTGTALTTLRPQFGDFIARSSTCGRGLPRPLSDHSPRTVLLGYM